MTSVITVHTMASAYHWRSLVFRGYIYPAVLFCWRKALLKAASQKGWYAIYILPPPANALPFILALKYLYKMVSQDSGWLWKQFPCFFLSWKYAEVQIYNLWCWILHLYIWLWGCVNLLRNSLKLHQTYTCTEMAATFVFPGSPLKQQGYAAPFTSVRTAWSSAAELTENKLQCYLGDSTLRSLLPTSKHKRKSWKINMMMHHLLFCIWNENKNPKIY